MNELTPATPSSGLADAGLDVPAIRKRAAPLRSDVVDALRKAIVDGRLAPGTRLIERELIEMTGVSRTVIREALRQLESETIVEIVPNKGPIVRRLTRSEAEDLYAIRSVLEGLAARMFALNAGAAEIAALKAALVRTVEAYKSGSPERILAVKNEFYRILYAGAGSETLSAMMTTLYARIWRWRALGLGHPHRTPGRSEESLAALSALCDALEQRDPDRAERIAREEGVNAGKEILRIFEATEADPA